VAAVEDQLQVSVLEARERCSCVIAGYYPVEHSPYDERRHLQAVELVEQHLPLSQERVQLSPQCGYVRLQVAR
jgi:hypothetical protein